MTEPERSQIAPLSDLLERLAAATTAVQALAPRVEAGEPWPRARHFGTEPEARWGPPEVLAHTAEMLRFWLGEITRILAGKGEPAPFGRTAEDDLRIGVIERDRTLPAAELVDRIVAETARYRARIAGLGEAELGRQGKHPTRGVMTVADVLREFAVVHLEAHVEQLREALDSA